MESSIQFSSIKEAIEDLRRGRFVIVVDDEDRENEGDLIMPAETVTAKAINFLATHGRGLICVSMTGERLEQLRLRPMVDNNTAKLGTRFTVSVDVLAGTTTGISADDRAATVRALVGIETKPEDLGRPGHIFPIEAVDGGVLKRAGHTEAAADLALLAGFKPMGVLCEIMDDDGSMARLPRLARFAREFDLKLITIKDLIAFRIKAEQLVTRLSTVEFPTDYGSFTLHLYKSEVDSHHHLALVKGDLSATEKPLVRVHSSCLTGDVFGSCRCDCGQQLHEAMRRIEREGTGVILYMRQEGRGIGLVNKLLAYQLQDKGLDTVEANEELGFGADLRDYGIGAQILADLGLKSIRLMTNNPKKVVGLKGYGIDIAERVELEVKPTRFNHRYLETKRDKLGHLLTLKEV